MYKIKKRFQVILLLSIIFLIITLSLILYNSYSTKRKNTTSAKANTTTSLAVAKKPPFDSTLLAKYMTTEAILLGSIDHISYYFNDLNTNATLKMDPERSWIPASTIKAFTVLEAFRQRHLGLIDFNQTITVSGNNVVPTALESDEFPRLHEGTETTIRQLVEAMIIQSDNTAFNVLLDILDRRNINATLKNYGLTETVVGEKLSLDDNQLAIDVSVPGRRSNTTTAKDLALLYALLYTHKIPDSQEIVSIFKRQKFKDMIPAHIPSEVEIAHKTGAWDPYYHDGGIVYKLDAPFIFAAFSNSGNPEIVAKLARVAYYQSADVVGKPMATIPTDDHPSNHHIYYLSQTTSDTEILGTSTSINSEKFPSITAQDLGITSSDFGINPAFSQIINKARILPNSPLFLIKRMVENVKVILAKNPNEKTRAYLDIAHNRISEAKALFSQKNFSGGYNLLNQSEDYLKSAVNESGKRNDSTSIEIKQLSDLRFSLLSETADKVDSSQKMQLIDTTYNLYKKYEADLVPHVVSSKVTNPTQQKPIIGTVTKVSGNIATLKLNDGTTKKTLITDTTPLRDFQNNTIQSASHLTVGSQISVIGTVSSDAVIVPQFILNNVPKELPKAHEGTVIEIDPNTNKLTIINAQGKQDVIIVNQHTLLKSRDTNVSLEGIKAGSQVAIFGVSTPNQNISPTLTPILPISPAGIIPTHPISPAPALTGQRLLNQIIPSRETTAIIISSQITIIPSGKPFFTPSPVESHKMTPQKTTISSSTSKPPIQVVKAVSVTVVTNGTGSKEVKKSSPPPPQEKKTIEPPKKQ